MKLELTEISLFFERLPTPLEGLRIVQIADMHTRGFHRQERALARILREPCDLVVTTGDSCWQTRIGNPFVDTCNTHDYHRIGLHREGLVFPPRAETALEVWKTLLKDLSLPMPVVAIQGNHDSEEFMQGLCDLGVRVLANQSCSLATPHGGQLGICGIRGFGRTTGDIPRSLMEMNSETFSIGLCHFPEMMESLAAAGLNLVLAGHTHGGQICRRQGKPLITHSWVGKHYVSGLSQRHKSWMYTSRGVGYSLLPLRVHCPAEIVRMTLHRGEPQRTQLRTTALS